MAEVIETRELHNYEILSDTGWEPLTHVHKTIKYDVWEVKSENHSLKCADKHILIRDNSEEVFVEDLCVGDLVKTNTGTEAIISVTHLDIEPEHMYDVSVDSDGHTFFSDGMLSHNSTMSSIFLLHYMLFNKDLVVAILANKESAAKEVLRRIKTAYKKLPLWLQQGIVSWNEKTLELENGMKLIAATTSSDSISGETVSMLYLDEFAKVKPHVAEEFITASLPTVSTGGKVIIVSTPLGLNHFYEFWSGAVRNDNAYYPIEVNWWEHPDRDDEWKRRELRRLNNDIRRFEQEYGNKFLGSSTTLIDGDILKRLNLEKPIEYKWNGVFGIYERPVSGAMYILGVDTAKGTGNDYSVVQVLRIYSEEKIDQVAVYRCNTIDTHDFAQVCIGISQYYDAPLMVENNDIGESLLSTMWYEYEFDNIINLDPNGLGVRSTRKSKLEAHLLLRRYANEKKLNIRDFDTISELSRYVEIRPNVWKGETQKTHDDCVTSLLWALYFITTDYFDSANLEVRTLDKQYDLTNSGPIMYLPD